MSLSRGEIARKAVHIGMGFVALALARLTWPQAAAGAIAAFGFNAFVLPRAGGRALFRERDRERGFPIGILLYPLVVLALVLLFRHDLPVAAAGWGILAFGDGFASLAGQGLGGPKLPWNRTKTWSGLSAFFTAGGLAAGFFFGFVRGIPASAAEWGAAFAAAAIAAAIESLPCEIDDNVLPPLVGAAAFAALLSATNNLGLLGSDAFHARALEGLLLSGVLAAGSLAFRLVRPSGAVAGFVLGSLIWAFGGAPAFALLLAFFVAGTAATRFGKRRKEALGKAEAAGGRRGAENVLANVSVAAFCVAVSALSPDGGTALRIAAAAAFATALMDTTGTEVGQAVRTPTVLLPDFRPVPPGTDGAVSVAGTAAGLAAAALLAGLAAGTGWIRLPALPIVVAAAFAGTVAESLLGREGAPFRVSNGHVLNFLNTLAGALAAWTLSRFLA